MSALTFPQSNYYGNNGQLLLATQSDQWANDSDSAHTWNSIFDRLYKDQMCHILSYSNLADIPAFATVCASWNHIILENNLIWIGFCVSIQQCPTRHVLPKYGDLLTSPQCHRALISEIEEEQKYTESLNVDKEHRFMKNKQSVNVDNECSARKAFRMATMTNSDCDEDERALYLEDIGSLEARDIASHYEQYGAVEVTLIGDSEIAQVVFLNVDALLMASVDCHPMIEGQQCRVTGYSTPDGHTFRDTEAISPPSVPDLVDISMFNTIFGLLDVHPSPGNMLRNPEDNHSNPSVPDVIPGELDFQHRGTGMITVLPSM